MAYCINVDRKMKKGNFKTLPMKNLVLGIWSEKRMKQKKTILTMAKLPYLTAIVLPE